MRNLGRPPGEYSMSDTLRKKYPRQSNAAANRDLHWCARRAPNASGAGLKQHSSPIRVPKAPRREEPRPNRHHGQCGRQAQKLRCRQRAHHWTDQSPQPVRGHRRHTEPPDAPACVRQEDDEFARPQRSVQLQRPCASLQQSPRQ